MEAEKTTGHWIIIKEPEVEQFIWAEFFENMNSVADDNKLLILNTGEKIRMPA